MSSDVNSDSGWPNGWIVAVVAGLIAAIVTRWIGDVGLTVAVLAGVFVFLVFGVLLGMFWGVPASAHDDQGHDDHGHSHDHGHSNDSHNSEHGNAPNDAGIPDDGYGQYHHKDSATAQMGANAAAPFIPPTLPVAVIATVPAHVAESESVKPVALPGPRDGKGDDLQVLEGIGPGLEKLCHDLGIWHFDQIAAWGPAEVAWMDGNLKGFKGRVTRDKWVRQAKLIGEVGIVELQRRAKTNDY